MRELNGIYMDMISQMNTHGISDKFRQPIMPNSGLRFRNRGDLQVLSARMHHTACEFPVLQ